MREPEMPGFVVVRGHPHALFKARVQLIEQMRIDTHANGDGEIADSRLAVEAPHLHPTNSNAPALAFDHSLDGFRWLQGKPKIVREGVCGSHGDDAQSDSSPHDRL